MGKPKSIFLSHSSKDKFFVRELGERLNEFDVDVWIDEAEINIGDSLQEKIGSAIENSDYIGVVLSSNSINSEWVKRELQIALQKELKAKKALVLPILIERVEIPPFLKDKLYADFTDPEDFDKEFQKLVKVLGASQTSQISSNRSILLPNTINEKSSFYTQQQESLVDFEDIRIIEIDDLKSYNPDPSRSLYNVYFKLSKIPPIEWQEVFNAERRFPRHTMWREAWISGDYIIVHCVPDEVEEYHAKDLIQDVTNTNEKYRKYLAEKEIKEAKEKEKRNEESAMLNKLKNKIKFS
jgi:hypothetical protein